jgi:hypothetical protein
MTHFTLEQSLRMHCWSRDARAGQMVVPESQPVGPAGTGTIVLEPARRAPTHSARAADVLRSEARIADIQLRIARRGMTAQGAATVTVVDAAGRPAPNITVVAQWNGSSASTELAKSGSGGIVQLRSRSSEAAAPQWTLTISDLLRSDGTSLATGLPVSRKVVTLGR